MEINKTLVRSGIVTSSLILTTTLLPGSAAADSVDGGGGNNVVIAQTTQASEPAIQSRLSVAFDSSSTVANQNLAQARATSCTGCVAEASAVQIVVVAGSPSTFVPVNAAVAYNYQCTACTSFAYAYQKVIQVPMQERLSGSAWQKLSVLNSEMNAVLHSEAAPSVMNAELAAYALQAANTVSSNLIATSNIESTQQSAQG